MQQAGRSNGRALRILHVIPTLTGGGAENFLCALALAFDGSRIRTGIMPVYPTGVPFDPDARAIDILPIDRTGRYDPGFLGRMIRAMRRFRPDVVHAHLHNGKYWGRIAALAAHVPIIIFTEHSPQGEKRSIPEALVDVLMNRLTDGVVTFTQRQRAMLAQNEGIPPAKLTVIENGIPLPAAPDASRRSDARRFLGVRDDEFAIVFVGRLVPIKNAPLAVRAMREIDADLRERIRLFVVGEGQDKLSLHALARTLGVQDRVTFLGHRDDAVHLLYGADVLYVPSHVEGMPLAALEAMTVGVPVMSSPWPGAEELLGNGEFGIVLADWEPKTAARAFEEAARNSRALRQIGERACAFARERYDIRRTARLHERYYAELARRKGL